MILLIALLGFQWSFASKSIPVWSWRIVDSLPHPSQRFTQGLFWQGQDLWECTGLVGQSTIYKSKGLVTDPKTKILGFREIDSIKTPAPHFGEGCIEHQGLLLVLTWQSGIGFVLDAKSLQTVGSFPIRGEGWGMTKSGDQLWMSNGSSRLYRLDPRTFLPADSLNINAQGKPLSRLNELEFYQQWILANVWTSDSVAVIDTKSGQVEAWLDFSSLKRKSCPKQTACDVLNGLAWDGQRLWVTGKFWPKIWAIEIASKTSGIPKRLK